MKIFYSDLFVLPLPEGHRFPMGKYALLKERVAEAGLVPPGNLLVPPGATDEQLLRVHDQEYLDQVVSGRLSQRQMRRIGFPWSPELVLRSRQSVGGTIAACRAASEDGLSVNLAGGTHHAHRDHGQGFCVFNDVVVGARAIQAEGRARSVIIIDCDVHQGNGTAAITDGDPAVFTFSIHAAKNFPFRKATSDLDIGLPDGTGDADYLAQLAWGLCRLPLREADLAIYLAGADPYAGDTLGRLTLTKAGLAQRDRLVFEACLAATLPVAVVLSGGYARQVDDIVDIHFFTVQIAAEVAPRFRTMRLRESHTGKV
jgi:acetoin utilization deacetylase AcuC-like enzyme